MQIRQEESFCAHVAIAVSTGHTQNEGGDALGVFIHKTANISCPSTNSSMLSLIIPHFSLNIATSCTKRPNSIHKKQDHCYQEKYTMALPRTRLKLSEMLEILVAHKPGHKYLKPNRKQHRMVRLDKQLREKNWEM